MTQTGALPLRQTVESTVLGLGRMVLPLAFLAAAAEGAAGQMKSGVAAVGLHAVAAPGARLEPLALAREVDLGLPFRVSVNAPYRLEIRRSPVPAMAPGSDLPLRVRTSQGGEEGLMAGDRVVWTARGGPGAVPLEAVRESLPPEALDGRGAPVVVYVVVAPAI